MPCGDCWKRRMMNVGIRRDCVSWDPQTHTCKALIQLVCLEKDCNFFMRPEQKKLKDELTRERLERIGYTVDLPQNTNGRGEKKRNRAAYQSAYYKNQYEDRRARGVCVKCGIEKARPGKTKCEVCADKIKKLKIRNAV